MSLEFTCDGAPLAQDVAPSGINITSRADQGDPAFGGIPIQDPAAGLDSVGHRPFIVEESACSQPRLFTGWVTQRDMSRSEERALIVDGARLHDMTIVDLNALFNFRHIRGAEGKRPAETWTQRRDWIIGSPFLAGLIEDTGYVGDLLVERDMDETDYRGQYPSAVFADLVERTGDRINYFAFWDPYAEAVSLFIGHLADSTGDSSLAISNVLDDVNATTFAPSVDAVLAREPDAVYSEVTLVWANGRVFRRRQSTESTYIRRGTQIDRPYCKSASRAQELAEAFLDRHDSETDRITVKILVPADSAGLAMAGQRIEVKFSHLPGYETWTWMRIAQSTPTPIDDVAAFYDIALELVQPQAGGGPPPSGCDEDETSSGTFEHLGTNVSDATGIVAYMTTGMEFPEYATPFYDGNLTFPSYDFGGYADMAEAAYWGIDPKAEQVRFLMVGAGSLEIHTATAAKDGVPPSDTNTCVVEVWQVVDDGEDILISTSERVPWGSTITVTMPARTEGACYYYASLWGGGYVANNCWAGFAYAVWTLGEVDEEEDLGASQSQTVEATTDPTVNDDAADGYIVGQRWVNTTTGEAFILVDATAGAAVWQSLTAGAPTDVDYLVGTASAALSAEIVVGATPGGELGGTWASPTVDATHSGSAHLLLGSTSSTAAAGDHTLHQGGMWRPLMDGLGNVVTDGATGEAIMALS